MPKYIRVKDESSGHELSILATARQEGYQVLDQPADHNGVPLPPKHNTKATEPEPVAETPDPDPAPETPAPRKKHGRQADTTKETERAD